MKFLISFKNNFSFKATKESFFVYEIPSITLNKKGKYLLIEVIKQNLSTWECLDIIASFLGIHSSKIGYSGLKDKYATTLQYFSLSSLYKKDLEKFTHPQIKIKNFFYSDEKLHIGQLVGNRFEVILSDVESLYAGKIEKSLRKLSKIGVPNYFGEQRFGSYKSLEQAKKMIDGDLFIKDKKLQKFLYGVYQSYLFNQWLEKRILESSDNVFKLLSGEVYYNPKKEVYFRSKKILTQLFLEKQVIPTGLLPGKNVIRSIDKARKIEEKFDLLIDTRGYRREAIVFPKNITVKYHPQTKKLTLGFMLSKGSYASVIINALK